MPSATIPGLPRRWGYYEMTTVWLAGALAGDGPRATQARPGALALETVANESWRGRREACCIAHYSVSVQPTHLCSFSFDASVRIEADDHLGLERERLLRYCARPAFALERLREIDAGRLVYATVKPGAGDNVTLILSFGSSRNRVGDL